MVVEFNKEEKNQIENKTIGYNDIKNYSVSNLTQLNSFFETLQNERTLSAIDNPLKESTGSELESLSDCRRLRMILELIKRINVFYRVLIQLL